MTVFAALARPIDTTDIAAVLPRQEMRTYLRGLTDGDRMRVLTGNPDPTMLAAALEGPAMLSGLTTESRHRVADAHLQMSHGGQLRALEERDEALNVVDAAAQLTVREVQAHRRSRGPSIFESWFATADGVDARTEA